MAVWPIGNIVTSTKLFYVEPG